MLDEMDIPSVRRMYNWFHYAFPDYRNNDLCTGEDIKLRNSLEGWLIAHGE